MRAGWILLAFLAGCQGAEATSALDVTNAEDAEGRFPGIVKLTLFTPEGRGTCTGSFITETAIITASHCVEGVNGIEVNGIPATDFIAHPNWISRNQNTYGYDVAIVKFAQPSATEIVPLAVTPPQVGDRARIVGYGFTDWNTGNDSGRKRTGETIIDDVTVMGGATMISSGGCNGSNCSKSATASAIGQGDSGGPLLVNDRIVGIASLGGTDGRTVQSLHAHLFLQANIDFIKQNVPDLDVSMTAIDNGYDDRSQSGFEASPGYRQSEPDSYAGDPRFAQPSPRNGNPNQPQQAPGGAGSGGGSRAGCGS